MPFRNLPTTHKISLSAFRILGGLSTIITVDRQDGINWNPRSTYPRQGGAKPLTQQHTASLWEVGVALTQFLPTSVISKKHPFYHPFCDSGSIDTAKDLYAPIDVLHAIQCLWEGRKRFEHKRANKVKEYGTFCSRIDTSGALMTDSDFREQPKPSKKLRLVWMWTCVRICSPFSHSNHARSTWLIIPIESVIAIKLGSRSERRLAPIVARRVAKTAERRRSLLDRSGARTNQHDSAVRE